MKKIILLLPAVLILTSCSILPNEQNKENDLIIEENLITIEPTLQISPEPTDNINLPIDQGDVPTTQPSPSPEEQSTTASSLSPENTLPPPSDNLPKETTPTENPEINNVPQYEEGTEEGKKAINFSGKNLADNLISLSDYKGKKVFLNFWATWCGPCVRELPSIQKIHENYPDIKIITVNCGENSNDVKNFMDRNNYTFPVLIDESSTISYSYFADYIPLTLIIDENGIITKRHVGSLTEDEMLNLIGKGEE